ncbi:GDSL esterase/lipase At1g71250-like [Magnolia sinica]|uniref:GDSL esterase/lipase At1g71250-like n=1 Tax=Magnolia sinica TaxID=86752 RepID=UPI00265AF096|nr:GDSL esterase/lipase At1g71250-like [Magnolia sinica]XP_058108938.1 GDSL esterase/lipase At1g71250-like [Magnolia sinica]
MRKSKENENSVLRSFQERKEMERRFSKLLLLFALAVFSTVLRRITILPSVEGQSSGSPVSAFFILGDSSVNCGDNFFFYPYLPRNSSSYLCNTSDRRLIPDFLAEKMGLPMVPSFYSQNRTLEGLLGGLNFGSSPATIMNWGGAIYQGLNQQLGQAFETLQLLQLQLGIEKAREVAQSSLFYLSIGKDDYIEFLRDPDGIRERHGPHKFARMLVNQVTRVVKDLYNANVRKIICMGIEPLGCTPRSLWQACNATTCAHDRCIDTINGLIVEYNTMLSMDLLGLNQQLPNAQIVFCDLYRGMMAMIMDPKSYGFDDVSSACCGLGRYGGRVGCVSRQLACGERARHVWWDLYNPTEAANQLLADWMWSGSSLDICHPITVQQLASAPARTVARTPCHQ